MSENGIQIGGGLADGNIIWGNENTVIQVINHVYNQDDLIQLVRDSFKDPAQLHDIWTRTFPAIDPKLRLRSMNLQPQSLYSDLLIDFERNNELARLLAEIKQRSPALYWQFLAGQVLAPIGLSATQIPVINTDVKTVEQELRGLQGEVSPVKGPSEDSLEFEDREELFPRIRSARNIRIVLHGPSGVGKTYLLQHLKEKYARDTRCTFIDLNSCRPANILPMIVGQLSGERNTDAGYLDLAKALDVLLNQRPRIRHFYFLFDNADQNQAAIDYLFSPESIIENPDLQHLLRRWGLQGKIELKIILAARHPLLPTEIFPTFSKAAQIKLDPLDGRSVRDMLEAIVNQMDLPVPLSDILELSNEVYYLTGGHPKCTKQMLLALAAEGCVIPPGGWERLYKRHVISTIYEEMLRSMEFDLLPVIWNLSVFRRFDRELLEGLLDREILQSQAADKSRYAREMRARLEKINLFDKEDATSSILPNYVMRRALSLNMQLNALARYQMLNSLALEIYLDRIQSSEAGVKKPAERMAMNLLELLYHWTKLLEVETAKENPPDAATIVTRLLGAFERSLLLAMTAVQDEEHPALLHVLKARWSQDHELQEAIERVTPGQDYEEQFMHVLEKYAAPRDEVE